MKQLLGFLIALSLAAVIGTSPASAIIIDPGSGVILNVNAVEGAQFSGPVAQFHTVSPPATYTAEINWGDGSAKDTVSATHISGGDYQVSGTHTYGEAGDKEITVRLLNGYGQEMLTATATRTVADAPLTPIGTDFTLDPGEEFFRGEVGAFTDADPNSSAREFTARVHWGDGDESQGTIVRREEGGFRVLDTHTYANAGTYDVKTYITSEHGAQTTIASKAYVRGAVSAEFTWQPNRPCSGEQVMFDASASQAATGIVRYDWSFDHNRNIVKTPARMPSANMDVDMESGAINKYIAPPFKVTLTVTDAAGQTATVSHYVTFADDGYRPPDGRTPPICVDGGIITPMPADTPVAGMLGGPITFVKLNPKFWGMHLPCATIADCLAVVKVFTLKKRLISRGSGFVAAGQAGDIPLKATKLGKRFRGKAVKVHVGFRDTLGAIAWTPWQRFRVR